ncbi:hypothetical protein, partial [Escherichia coli]|uniref:hypothetical protein n=1 Tax=Escherichia coli TaxID=562 RepID=UPI000F887EB7
WGFEWLIFKINEKLKHHYQSDIEPKKKKKKCLTFVLFLSFPVHVSMNRLMWNAFYRSHALPKIDSFFKSQVTLSLKWPYTIRNRDFHRNCMN